MNFFSADLIFTPEVLVLCKIKWSPRGLVAIKFDILFLLQIFLKEKDYYTTFFFNMTFFKLNGIIKFVFPMTSRKIFFRKDGDFV